MKRWMVFLVMVSLAGSFVATSRAERSSVGRRVETELIEVPDLECADPLRIEVWVDGGDDAIYFPGETVTLRFRTNRDAYVLLYDIDTRGQVRQLFPRSRRDDEFVEGGVIHTIPRHRAGYRLVVGGPAGEEFVTAVASDRPLAHRWERIGNRSIGGLKLDRMGPTALPSWISRGNPLMEMDRIQSRLMEERNDDGDVDYAGHRRRHAELARDVVRFTVGECRHHAWR